MSCVTWPNMPPSTMGRREAPGVFSASHADGPPGLPATATAAANRYRVPVAVIPSGKISFQAVMKRFISSSVPIETRR